MKFNTTYIPALGLLETLVIIQETKKTISDYLNKKFNLVEVSSPLFLEEKNNLHVDISSISRSVSFDLGDEGIVAKLVSSPSNWLRNLIDRINLKDKEGVISFNKSIIRDAKESPTNTVVDEEITIQIKINDIDNIERLCQELSFEMYELIYELAENIQTKYKIVNQLPQDIQIVTSQQLENEIPNSTPEEREVSFIFEYNAFFLNGPGTIMHSGHIHTPIPPEVYDLTNFQQLVLNDKINNFVIKPMSISILANGLQLDDQLRLYDREFLRTNIFYKKLVKQKFKIIELKFNIPKLVMSLLQKGHISELQPSVISEESNIISLRHKVEKL